MTSICPLSYRAAATAVLLLAALSPPAAAVPPCPGDCGGDRVVGIAELTTVVALAIGDAALSACPAADADGDGRVLVADVVAAVRTGLEGCGVDSLDQLRVPGDFSYDSTQVVMLEVTVLNPNGAAVPGAVVSAVVDGGVAARGLTDASGRYSAALRVPAHLHGLQLRSTALGVPNQAMVPIVAGAARHLFQ